MSYPKPIHWWVDNVLPLVYDDALSYYEVVSKVVGYINGLTTDMNTVKDKITEIEAFLENIDPEKIAELLEKVDELETIVNGFEDRLSEAETDIGALKSRVDTTENDIDALEDRVNTTENNIELLEENDNELMNEISIGPNSMATFETKFGDVPIEKCIVNIEPVQTGSGEPSPDNIRPIYGWTGCNITRAGKNLFDGIVESGYLDINTGEPVTNTSQYRCKNFIRVLPNTPYSIKVSDSAVSASVSTRICFYDKRKQFISSPPSFENNYNITTPPTCTYIKFFVNQAIDSYDNTICIASGENDFTYVAPQVITTPITFPSESGAVYEGTLTINANGSGKLIITHEYVNLGDCLRGYALIIDDANLGIVRFSSVAGFPHVPLRGGYTYCNMFKGTTVVNAYQWEDNTIGFTNSQTNLFLRIRSSAFVGKTTTEIADILQNVYAGAPLFEPAEITLTDIATITTIFGINNIWADCGNISVTYGKYLSTIYESLNGRINELQALVLENIGG